MLALLLTLLLAACGSADVPADPQDSAEPGATRLLLVDPESADLTALDDSVVAGTISLRLEDDQGLEQAGYLLNLPADSELTDELLAAMVTADSSDAGLLFELDTTSLADGLHTLTVVSKGRYGKLRSIAHSRFHVSNRRGTKPPDNGWKPRPPRPPAPTPPVDEKPEPPVVVDPPETEEPVPPIVNPPRPEKPRPPVVDSPEPETPVTPPPPVAPPPGGSGNHWKPAPGLTWYWQLTGTIDMNQNVDVYDIDYQNPASTVAALHAKGKKVIAYVPVGDWESYRPDSNDFPEEALCGAIDGWPERYIDIRHPKAVELIKARIAAAAKAGFDGIEGDVVDGHRTGTGCRTPITRAEMTAYLKDLTDYSHSLGLAYFAKNTSEDAAAWSQFTDGVVVEEAYAWNEAADYMPYINAGKPVFAVEYGTNSPSSAHCADANSRNIALYGTDLALTGKVYRTCW